MELGVLELGVDGGWTAAVARVGEEEDDDLPDGLEDALTPGDSSTATGGLPRLSRSEKGIDTGGVPCT
ncbi:hypothetical protein [Actinacidiphila sp. bgisy167]|uniref:hypothetical protein n=1 Tax=Actinacidiphila sp. bgisy167 TaxID=3413797 RepID=UPI003D70752D